jgi:hypothetical protein
MSRSLGSLASLAVVALAGCASGSSVVTTSDFDPSIDFAAYRTYYWAPDGEDLAEPPIDGYIRAAVEAELESKGLRRADGDAGDLAVAYKVATTTHTEQEYLGSGFGSGYRREYSGGGVGIGQRTTEHLAGTLYVVLFDGDTQHMVWTGVGNDSVDPDRSDAERQTKITEAVKEIMKAYPPG